MCCLFTGWGCDQFLAQGNRADTVGDIISFNHAASTVLVRLEVGLPLLLADAGLSGPCVLLLCSAAFLVQLATARWSSLGGSGNRSDEEARSLPLIGTCGDSRRFVGKARMVHAIKSHASMLVGQSGQSSTPHTSPSTKYEGLLSSTWKE